MKKILTLLGVMVLSAGASFAAIEENKTSDIEILRSQGYSESALRIVDTVKANNQGPTGKYKRYFIRKKDTPYTVIKNYVDPIQDDGDFGVRQINYTNTWKGNETYYSTKVKRVEDL